ncbi:MAG: MFS transporter [Candidatus Odinarchaeota archaeon]
MSNSVEEIQRPKLSFGLILVSNVIWIFGLFLYVNFIGLFMRDVLGANSVQVGFWSTVFSLSMMLFVGLGGTLTAKLGAKRTMILGWIGILPAPIIYMFAPTWQIVLIGAFFEGLSGLAGAPIGPYISALSRSSRRGQAFTILSASTAIGGIPSPVLGGIIIQLYGYPILFFIVAILFAVSSLLIIPISNLRQDKTDETEKRSWEFFKNRIFIFSTLLWFTINTLVFITQIFVPLFLSDRFGLNEAQIGALSTITNACGAVIGPLLGWLGDRWSYTGSLTFPIVGTLGFYGLLLVIPNAAFLPFVYGFRGLVYGLNSLTNAILSHYIPKVQLADSLSAYYLIGRTLTPITPIIGGIAFAYNASLPLMVSSMLMPIAFIFLILIHRASTKVKRIEREEVEEVPSIVREELHPPV